MTDKQDNTTNSLVLCLNMLEYKLIDRGKYFIKIDRYYPSSQICHQCGRIHSEKKRRFTYTDVCINLIYGRDGIARTSTHVDIM